MAPHYEVFYSLEKTIRTLVSETLATEEGEQWWHGERVPQQVRAEAEKRRGPIAHCSPLAEDEIVRLRLSVRDWYRLQE